MAGNDGYGGLFADTGSPPVILGFLAVGLFVVALVVVFGFRRMQNGRWNNPHQNFFTVDRSPSQDIGEKPTLWELHASHNEERWCNMRPISASLDHIKLPPIPPTPKLTAIQRLLIWLRLRHRQPPPLSPKKLTAASTTESIQVAVAVVMPSSELDSQKKQQKDTPVFELGVTVLPFAAGASLNSL